MLELTILDESSVEMKSEHRVVVQVQGLSAQQLKLRIAYLLTQCCNVCDNFIRIRDRKPKEQLSLTDLSFRASTAVTLSADAAGIALELHLVQGTYNDLYWVLEEEGAFEPDRYTSAIAEAVAQIRAWTPCPPDTDLTDLSCTSCVVIELDVNKVKNRFGIETDALALFLEHVLETLREDIVFNRVWRSDRVDATFEMRGQL